MTNIDKRNETIIEKVSIMIDIMMDIMNIPYSECYTIIKQSNTYKLMLNGDIPTLYDSPQASLISISQEKDSLVPNVFTIEVIKNYTLRKRKKDLET